MTYICLIGNTDACNAWWQNNGKLPSSAKTEDMTCFENTEVNQILDDAIENTNEILRLIQAVEIEQNITEKQPQEKENPFEMIRGNIMGLTEKYPHLNSLQALLKEAEESEEE